MPARFGLNDARKRRVKLRTEITFSVACLIRFSSNVLEYPGYGLREGNPSLKSLSKRVRRPYHLCDRRTRTRPFWCPGKSLLAAAPLHSSSCQGEVARDKIVLVVPFDSLRASLQTVLYFLPVRLMLRRRLDNVETLGT